jgi:hypothetical protein
MREKKRADKAPLDVGRVDRCQMSMVQAVMQERIAKYAQIDHECKSLLDTKLTFNRERDDQDALLCIQM